MKFFSLPCTPAALLLLTINGAFSFSSTSLASTRDRSVSLGMGMKDVKDNDVADIIDRREALRTTIATLGFGAAAMIPRAPAFAAFDPNNVYLSDPTEEFKESERQRAEFRRAQLEIKKKFDVVLTRLTTESKTEEELVTDLKELKGLVTSTGGLPLGIKKDDLVKLVRSKKAKGFWPTDVEYSYQALIREIAYQQSPNKDKDIENPL
uniref:RxLR effector protein n=1 Tax=Helicotheca tamesis TaxID=374047 RepID=A0A7S2IAH0_9STRA|mmetsp:Transcript_7323/g.9970  ORF Transcript_7323/g.9970 Transcript_7323/m.9970 type:complete len:208 (+) Transcript_7323:108-731(+)